MEHMHNDTNATQNTGCSAGCGCAAKDAEKHPARTYLPAVDLLHSQDAYTLVVDIPGVPHEGIDLQVEKNTLTLRATPTEGTVADMRLAYAEYGVGRYERTFTLPEDIDRDTIAASLKNGVLRITLSKVVPATKRISIN